mmetsp:Transcript_39764/g.62062  ORF Transcript_39764/g.62062 Transcript_39764/m.62062 type:complete len:296 (-) Transcript_39764:3-890(-)
MANSTSHSAVSFFTFSFFSGLVQTSTSIVLPLSSLPFTIDTALATSSALSYVTTALPPLARMSTNLGFANKSSKCLDNSLNVVFSVKPPTHTFKEGSISFSFSATLLTGFFTFNCVFLGCCFFFFGLSSSPSSLGGFSVFVQTSTSMLFPSSSVPLSTATAVLTSSSFLKHITPVPFFSLTSTTAGLRSAVSRTCFSNFFQVVVLDIPPTQTFLEASNLRSFSFVLSTTCAPLPLPLAMNGDAIMPPKPAGNQSHPPPPPAFPLPLLATCAFGFFLITAMAKSDTRRNSGGKQPA